MAMDLRAEVLQPGLDAAAMAAQPVAELEVAGRVRVGELVAHDDLAVRGLSVERVAGRVRPAVLHRLEHPRHVEPDRVRPVPVDDPCDPAHVAPFVYGRTSR